MSKHHFPPSSFHSTSKKSHLDLEMAIHHGSNGLRANSNINVASETNDSNNNYNNKHTHHKRSAAGVSGEASSSKRTKLSAQSDKNPKEDFCGTKVHQQNYYNIMEKLKELYKESKEDKSCKEVNQ